MANIVGGNKSGGKDDGEEEIDRFRERIREAAGLFSFFKLILIF